MAHKMRETEAESKLHASTLQLSGETCFAEGQGRGPTLSQGLRPHPVARPQGQLICRLSFFLTLELFTMGPLTAEDIRPWHGLEKL